jgi:hypothetical protein
LGKRFGKEEEKKAPGFTPLVVVFPRPSLFQELNNGASSLH